LLTPDEANNRISTIKWETYQLIYNTGDKAPLILVVDDDWMNREVMEAHLLAADYRVMLARDGEEALKLSIEHNPDLILLDVRMQGISGYEVCAQIRAYEQTKHTPVILVTALDSDEERLKGVEAGVDDFITKPFSSLTMLTRVKSLVRISRLQRELEAMRRLLNQQNVPAAGGSALGSEK
jgi:two-component system cell cycle response regulator